jgi:HEPN domain-containing protein
VTDEFSLSSERRDEAERLLRAARSDLRAATALAADASQESDVIGFHAQQAVEKSLKAVLVTEGREIPYTHDLGFLLDLLNDDLITPPAPIQQADSLTPWAVAVRYGASGAELDRQAALDVAGAAVRWAAAFLAGKAPGPI